MLNAGHSYACCGTFFLLKRFGKSEWNQRSPWRRDHEASTGDKSRESLVDWPCALKARFGTAQCTLNFNDLNHLTLTKVCSAYQSPTVYFFNDHVIDWCRWRGYNHWEMGCWGPPVIRSSRCSGPQGHCWGPCRPCPLLDESTTCSFRCRKLRCSSPTSGVPRSFPA